MTNTASKAKCKPEIPENANFRLPREMSFSIDKNKLEFHKLEIFW